MEWTVARVKDELPSVPVLFHQAGMSITIDCVVCGRKNKFATVRPFEFGSATEWTFAWETIAHALNSSNPLRVD